MILGIGLVAQLPPVAQRLVCTESATGSIYGPYPKLVWNVNYIPHCSSCRKHPIQYLYECSACETYFVKDYLHPGFCYREPLCWDCLPSDSVCDHCMLGWNERMLATRLRIRPPLKRKVVLDPDFDPFTVSLDFG